MRYHWVTVWIRVTPGNTALQGWAKSSSAVGRRNRSPVPGSPRPPRHRSRQLKCRGAPTARFPSALWACVGWPACSSPAMLVTHCSVFALERATGPQVLGFLRRRRLKVSPSPYALRPSQRRSLALGPTHCPWTDTGGSQQSPWGRCGGRGRGCHFLKGVSLVKVCHSSEGFRRGSASAKTGCCGTLVGTVT